MYIKNKYLKKKYVGSEENKKFELEREFNMKEFEKRGFLYKQGEKNKSWRKRFFIIQQNEISYYKSEKDSTPAGFFFFYTLGTIVVEPTTLISFIDERQVEKTNCFAIVLGKRTYLLNCDDDEQLAEWVCCLRAAVYFTSLLEIVNDGRVK
jgi:hypothetical protein